ncbi:MAG: S41 family peptidase [Candidatus Eiseniibacteriota bacterium]
MIRILTGLVFAMFALFGLVVANCSAQATPSDGGVDAARRRSVIDGVLLEIERSYVLVEKTKDAERLLRARARNGEYDALTDGASFAGALTEDLRAATGDTHFLVRYSAEALPATFGVDAPETPEQREERRQDLAWVNGGVVEAKRLPGNVGLLDLDAFVDPELGGDAVAGAMELLSRTAALIIDLRWNTGGDGRMVAFLASWFFAGEPVHLDDVYVRPENFTLQNWTVPYVPGAKYLDREVWLLTSGKTHSAAEGFAFALQELGRAKVVGETTRGGAHPIRRFRVDDHFGVQVPIARAINPRTGSNWEGVGVKPDIEVPMDAALRTAHLAALRGMLDAGADEGRVDDIRRALDRLETEDARAAAAAAADPAKLDAFVGRFETPMGLLSIRRLDSGLEATLAGETPVLLVPLGPDRFEAPDVGARFEFRRDAAGTVGEVVILLGDQEASGKRIP